MPGMYAVTSMPEVRRTRATLRGAEFGFFGVVVKTRVHTPRRCGEPLRAGVLVFSAFDSRPLRTSWAIVGTRFFPLRFLALEFRTRWEVRSAPTRSEPTCERSRTGVRPQAGRTLIVSRRLRHRLGRRHRDRSHSGRRQ